MPILRTIWNTIKFIARSHSHQNDPVCSCPVYLDHEKGSCSHVDGFLCDFPKCDLIKRYEQERAEVSRTQ